MPTLPTNASSVLGCSGSIDPRHSISLNLEPDQRRAWGSLRPTNVSWNPKTSLMVMSDVPPSRSTVTGAIEWRGATVKNEMICQKCVASLSACHNAYSELGDIVIEEVMDHDKHHKPRACAAVSRQSYLHEGFSSVMMGTAALAINEHYKNPTPHSGASNSTSRAF